MESNTKEWIQYGSAIFMIISGSLLSFISFFTLGTVVGGVLLYLSEALVFAGAVYGVNLYYKTKFGKFETSAVNKLRDEIADKLDKYLSSKENKTDK